MENSTIVAIASAVISAFGGAFIGKRHEAAKAKKTDAEAESINVATTEKAIAIWEQLNGQLHTELGALRIQIDALKLENGNMHRENNELRKQIESLSGEVQALKQILKGK